MWCTACRTATRLFSREQAHEHVRARADETDDCGREDEEGRVSFALMLENARHARASPATENKINAMYPLTVACAPLSDALPVAVLFAHRPRD